MHPDRVGPAPGSPLPGDGADVVLVHDAARPLTPPDVVAPGRWPRWPPAHAAVVPVLPVVDTVKRVDADGRRRRRP